MSWAVYRDTLTHRVCARHGRRHRWHGTCVTCDAERSLARMRREAAQLRAVADACEAMR